MCIRDSIKTLPYPGFPTDMQPQMTTALCLAEGTSIITEGIWGSRYRYTEAVSYTHLDVYKRQAQRRGLRVRRPGRSDRIRPAGDRLYPCLLYTSRCV